MYIFRFFSVLCQLGLRVIFLRKSTERKMYRLLQALEKEFDGAFHQDTFKKIVKYNSLHFLLNFYIFCKLQGRAISKEERNKLRHYAILHVLFDNFFDEKTLSIDQIKSMTFSPETYTPATFEEKVFLKSGLFLLAEVKDREEYLQVCKKILDTQIDSLEQFNPYIACQRLHDITFQKGGYAISLCRFFMDSPISNAEKNCWFLLGELVQLSTDIFDIYQDLQDGIQTIPLYLQDAYAMEKLYEQKTEEMKAMMMRLPFPLSRQKDFRILMMSIVSFGFVGTAHLKDLQAGKQSLPDLKALPRKALIVDMEKYINMKRWVTISFRLGNMK